MMRLALSSIAIVTLCIGVAAQEDSKVPKDFVQLSVTGCVKSRILTATHTPKVVDGDEILVPVDRFQISGKKPILAEVKKYDRQKVEVVGLVRKSDLREPGIRVPGGRLVISPGRGRGRYEPPTGSSRRVVLLQAESVRSVPGDCDR